METTLTYDVFPEMIPGFIVRIAKAFPTTLVIMVSTLAISLVLGLVVALAQLCGGRWAAAVARGWVSLMRGVPALVMIFLFYFGLPQVVRAAFGVNIASANKIYFVVAALSLMASANVGEAMRSAYQAVPRLQTEAALSVGMTPRQAVARVVLPQAAAVAIPLFGNIVVSLFKGTSLAFSIGVLDMMGRADVIAAANYGAYRIEIYAAVAIIYWATCVVLMLAFSGAEHAVTRGRRRAAA